MQCHASLTKSSKKYCYEGAFACLDNVVGITRYGHDANLKKSLGIAKKYIILLQTKRNVFTHLIQ